MSSKLSKLKQEAYQAGKKRNWIEAISIYERVLELDKNNPALLNELGDMCLRNGDPDKAVRQFLNAASKYRQTGLLNNAVAVYKKVLRHDGDNLNAHWFLAEIRSSQSLFVEGEVHAERFLAAADGVAGEIKEIFLKRCVQLMSLYPRSRALLERLQGVFRIWNLPLEDARIACLLACEQHLGGDAAGARELVARAVDAVPEVVNYGEYDRWLEAIGTRVAGPLDQDVNTIRFDEEARPVAAPPPVPAAPVVEVERIELDAFERFIAGGGESPAPPMMDDDAGGDLDGDAQECDEDGCISIDVDDEVSFADLIQAAAQCMVHGGEPAADEAASRESPSVPAPSRESGADIPSGSVDLLREILEETGDEFDGGAERQLEVITTEIGAQLAGSEEGDPESSYQQGLVYLELGLFGQAAAAFGRASRDPVWALRACEMRGVALLRADELDSALRSFERGIAVPDAPPQDTLGLLYHAGQTCERLGRETDALTWYERAHAIDPTFLDVGRRIRVLVS